MRQVKCPPYSGQQARPTSPRVLSSQRRFRDEARPHVSSGLRKSRDRTLEMPNISESFARRIDWALVAVGLAVCLWMEHGAWGDGEMRANYIRQLLTDGKHLEHWYSYIGPLFSTPLLWVDRKLDLNEWLFTRFNVFVLAGGLVFAHRLLVPVADARLLRMTGLMLICASLFPLPMLTFYGETFTSVGLAVGIIAVATGRYWGWVIAAVASANTAGTIPALGMAALYFGLTEGKLRHFAAPLMAVGLMVLESYIRRGTWIDHNYLDTGVAAARYTDSGLGSFGHPFVAGALGLIFAFGRGLIWWQPSLLFAFRRQALSDPLERALRAWFWACLGLLVVYAKWWAWHGAAWSGPRFLIFATFPAMLLLAQAVLAPPTSVTRSIATFCALVWSVYAAVNSASFNYFKTLDRDPACHAYEGILCVWTPYFSTLLVPFWKPFVMNRGEVAFAIFAGVAFLWIWLSSPVNPGAALKQAGSRFLRDRVLRAWKL